MKHSNNLTISDQLSRLISLISGKGLRVQLARAGIGSLAVTVANIVLGLVLSVVLARTLGPEGYGNYAYVFALISILSIPAQFGLPRLVVRETAKTEVNKQWGLMRGIWRWSDTVASVLSLTLVIVSLFVLWLMADRFSQVQLATFLWGLAMVPLIVLGTLRGAALQGLRCVVLAELPKATLRPGFLLLLILSFVWLGGREQLTAATAMGFHALAAGLAFLVGIWFLRRNRPTPLVAGPTPVYQKRLWFSSVLPLALAAGMLQINRYTDIVMLGYFMSAQDVGIYRIAVQGAWLTSFGLQVIGMFISPYFARLHEQKDIERLQHLATYSARIAVIVALPSFFIVCIWGNELIQLFFGYSYITGYTPLVILACGQLIHSFFGFVGIILNMSGYQRDMARGVAITAGINIVLNAALIPVFGMAGAAAATALTLVIFNIILWRDVHRRLNIDTTAIGTYKANSDRDTGTTGSCHSSQDQEK